MLKDILLFVGGVAAGAVASFFITKKYCDKIKEEEIASIKEHFTVPKKDISDSRKKTEKTEEPSDEVEVDLTDIPKYDPRTASKKNTNYTSMYSKDRKQFEVVDHRAFDCSYDFISRYLNYYLTDKVLTNADSDDILDAVKTIGIEAAKELTSEKDILHVLDNVNKMRYEIYIIRAAFNGDDPIG